MCLLPWTTPPGCLHQCIKIHVTHKWWCLSRYVRTLEMEVWFFIDWYVSVKEARLEICQEKYVLLDLSSLLEDKLLCVLFLSVKLSDQQADGAGFFIFFFFCPVNHMTCRLKHKCTQNTLRIHFCAWQMWPMAAMDNPDCWVWGTKDLASAVTQHLSGSCSVLPNPCRMKEE